jgi:hypothetical protein
MKALALFFVIPLLASNTVAQTVQSVAGHYVLENTREVGSELLLKPDGQFEYMLAYGAADYAATGKWRIANDAVILDAKVPEGPPFRLVSSSQKKSPVIRIWIRGKTGTPVPNLDVVLTTSTGEKTARTDQDGAAVFPAEGKPKSAQIEVRVYQLNAGPYSLNPDHNEFNFEINGEVITTVPFRNEPLKIKGDTLEMLYWDKTTPMVYRKQHEN